MATISPSVAGVSVYARQEVFRSLRRNEHDFPEPVDEGSCCLEELHLLSLAAQPLKTTFRKDRIEQHQPLHGTGERDGLLRFDAEATLPHLLRIAALPGESKSTPAQRSIKQWLEGDER